MARLSRNRQSEIVDFLGRLGEYGDIEKALAREAMDDMNVLCDEWDEMDDVKVNRGGYYEEG